MRNTRHIPVLLSEVIDALAPVDGGHYVDATFGAGGYTTAILEAAICRVTALDRDPTAIEAGRKLAASCAPRLDLVLAPFSVLSDWAAQEPSDRPGPFDGIVFDLGVSSMQLDDADRGFSFQHDGPLDMRMWGAGGRVSDAEPGRSAADLVNDAEEEVLADIIYHYGEERRARAVARAIVAQRKTARIERTGELAALVARVVGRGGKDKIHPATRTFQGLRIAVNCELEQVALGLSGAERLLKPGGRLVVVTFHSLEDRIAKRFFAERAGKTASGSRHLPGNIQVARPSFQLVNQRPLGPGSEETVLNPRARSAKLRAGERLDAPAWPLDMAALGVPELRLD